jgi:hypothetical protein
MILGHKVFALQGGTGEDADQAEEVNNSELVDWADPRSNQVRGILLVLGQGFWQKDEVLTPFSTGGNPENTRIRRNYSAYAARRPGIQACKSQSAEAQAPQCSTQRAGILPPHAEGDGLSGVTRDGEANAFISGPAAFVGGVPLTRARNPWAIPEAST